MGRVHNTSINKRFILCLFTARSYCTDQKEGGGGRRKKRKKKGVYIYNPQDYGNHFNKKIMPSVLFKIYLTLLDNNCSG